MNLPAKRIIGKQDNFDSTLEQCGHDIALEEVDDRKSVIGRDEYAPCFHPSIYTSLY